MKKRIVCLLLAALLTVGLSSCSQGGNSSGDVKEDAVRGEGDETVDTNLKAALPTAPETLDPQRNALVEGAVCLVHLGEGLFRYKWDGSGVEYGLAENHSVSGDGLVWTLTIRKNARWSDGEPVTAEDFVYSIRRLADPDTAAPHAWEIVGRMKNGAASMQSGDAELIAQALGVTAADERTLEIALEYPCPYFDEILALPAMMPVRKDIVEAHGDDWASSAQTFVSAGPFRLREWTEREMILEPNEYHYAVEQLVPSTLTLLFEPDDEARAKALLEGAVQFAAGYPLERMQEMISTGRYGKAAVLGTCYVGFNHLREPLDNPDVRRALSLAIDREALANQVRKGAVAPADGFVGYGFNDADIGREFRLAGGKLISSDYEQARAEARRALAGAGYPEGEGFPTLVYLHADNSIQSAVAAELQKQWREVLQIEVGLSAREVLELHRLQKEGEYDLAGGSRIADYNDPLSLLEPFSADSGRNFSGYANPEFDRHLEIARASGDIMERMDALHTAEEVLLEGWACAPLYFCAGEYLVADGCRGWAVSSIGLVFFHRAEVERENRAA